MAVIRNKGNYISNDRFGFNTNHDNITKRIILHLILKHKKSINFKRSKNYKGNAYFTLTSVHKSSKFNTDCKQNITYWFQIINLSFTHRNSATFALKVAEFFIANK